MKPFLIALALLAGYGSASAADLKGDKDRVAVEYPEAAPKINWTGLYVGVQGGYGNANHHADVGFTGAKSPWDSIVNLDGLNGHGFIGGGRVGFDFVRGAFLVGAFGDYNFSNIKTELTVLDELDGSLEKQDEWTAGVRAGFLINSRTLIYGLVGYTETSYEASAVGEGSVEQDFQGWRVGGGLETAIAPNVFLGLEYTHTFYDEEDWHPSPNFHIVDELDEDSIMATLKYKLNANPGDLF